MPTTAASEPASTPTSGRNLPVAIGVGVGLFVAVAVGLLWAHWFFVLLVAAALCLASIEVHNALERKGMHAAIVPIVVGTAVSIVGGWLVAVFDVIQPSTFIVTCLGATVLASFTARLRHGPEGFLRDAAGSAFIVAYIPLMGVFVSLLMGESNGEFRILTIVFCVVAADTGAYAVGSQLGKHKLAPLISPSKTWEGVLGSVVFSVLVGVACALLLLRTSWWVGVLFGIAVALAATLGDLVESLIKRDAGIKDMSNFLPGHGGVMDRLDSMLVAFPVGWLVLNLALGA
ncbi:phosphatidate cytidylyltransferase [Tessaracoccus sp. OS52]|uniref:phosphatidate cytidylyltransferase n=1 Tax=Tessaracoccus sp. OS52 TaxID=2886691 RepID=UPI001D11129E|nr:phosphatidate cytidylyltransferase [Tessaracoccus sp. OS52]MCC2593307.1 phosphatidate cytidylyltransferase [Tessaracoccus sp. OS52]